MESVANGTRVYRLAANRDAYDAPMRQGRNGNAEHSAPRGFRRTAALLVLGSALLTAASVAGCAKGRRPTRVVLITLDTLRYDSFAGEGGEARMPALHALAKRGWNFERAYASTSTTQPTHASLLTGLPPWAHGVTRNGLVLADDRVTVAERFREHGFESHAVVASFPLHERFGFAQGFDGFVDDFDVPYVRIWEGQATEQGTFFSLAESVTREALAALDRADQGDQFFWFHYFDPHDPYGDAAGGSEVVEIPTLLSLAAKRDASLDNGLAAARARYDADLTAMDRSLARLFERLEEDEGRFDTHMVVTADHGESFGERLSIGHGKRVTREQVQVPLLVVSPRAKPRVRHDATTSVDIARTLLSLAGFQDDVFQGRDLVSSDRADLVFGMRRTFSVPKPELLSDGRRRALPPTWFFAVDGDDVLYAGNGQLVLVEDELGRELEGPAADDLRRKFAALESLLAAGGEAEAIQDEETLNALRTLGYAGE